MRRAALHPRNAYASDGCSGASEFRREFRRDPQRLPLSRARRHLRGDRVGGSADRSPGRPVCVKFVVDNQLPPALARLIQNEFGAEAAHVADIGLRDASDVDLWRYSSATGWILISKDEDFVNMSLHAPTAGLLWVRIGNCRRAFLFDVFRRVWPRIMERLQEEERSSRSDEAGSGGQPYSNRPKVNTSAPAARVTYCFPLTL